MNFDDLHQRASWSAFSISFEIYPAVKIVVLYSLRRTLFTLTRKWWSFGEGNNIRNVNIDTSCFFFFSTIAVYCENNGGEATLIIFLISFQNMRNKITIFFFKNWSIFPDKNALVLLFRKLYRLLKRFCSGTLRSWRDSVPELYEVVCFFVLRPIESEQSDHVLVLFRNRSFVVTEIAE